MSPGCNTGSAPAENPRAEAAGRAHLDGVGRRRESGHVCRFVGCVSSSDNVGHSLPDGWLGRSEGATHQNCSRTCSGPRSNPPWYPRNRSARILFNRDSFNTHERREEESCGARRQCKCSHRSPPIASACPYRYRVPAWVESALSSKGRLLRWTDEVSGVFESSSRK